MAPKLKLFVKSITSYVKLALGEASNEEVNDFFSLLKTEYSDYLHRRREHWKSEIMRARKRDPKALLDVFGTLYPTPEQAMDMEAEGEYFPLIDEFNKAQTRADKVIAIDALMHMEHASVPILELIFELPPGGLPHRWALRVLDKLAS